MALLQQTFLTSLKRKTSKITVLNNINLNLKTSLLNIKINNNDETYEKDLECLKIQIVIYFPNQKYAKKF